MVHDNTLSYRFWEHTCLDFILANGSNCTGGSHSSHWRLLWDGCPFVNVLLRDWTINLQRRYFKVYFTAATLDEDDPMTDPMTHIHQLLLDSLHSHTTHASSIVCSILGMAIFWIRNRPSLIDSIERAESKATRLNGNCTQQGSAQSPLPCAHHEHRLWEHRNLKNVIVEREPTVLG